MRRPSIAFEWQELDERQELPPSMTSDQVPRASRAAEEQRLLLGGATLFLVAALLVTPWVMGQAQRELAQVHDELARAVEVETRPEREATVSASARQESAATHQSHERVISLETQVFQHGVAAVLVKTQTDADGDGLPTVYRQMRFYRWTEQDWQPAEPAPFLWGQPERLATQHFDITYRSRDAQAVQAVAAELDALYEQVRRNLGLSSAPDRKIAVEVVMGEISFSQVRTGKRNDRILVASPALLAAPVSLTDEAILRQSILLHLVDREIGESASTHLVSLSSYPLLSAMRLWQTWDLGGPLAEWRELVRQWLYSHLQKIDDEHSLSPLAEYTELCPLHSLWWWETVSVHRRLPPPCSEMGQGTLEYWVLPSSRYSTRFTDLIRLRQRYEYYDDGATGTQRRFESVLGAALLDYAAATYGRDRIAALWPVLRKHEEWATLIPAVFGVSVEEFEAGWQAYLAEMLDD